MPEDKLVPVELSEVVLSVFDPSEFEGASAADPESFVVPSGFEVVFEVSLEELEPSSCIVLTCTRLMIFIFLVRDLL